MAEASLQALIHACLGELASERPLSPRQWQVCHPLGACRPPALGGFALACDACPERPFLYHACRDRHCPRCQRRACEQWCERQRAAVLPVTYHHLVLTLPHALDGWVQLHHRVLLTRILAHIDFLEESLAQLQAEMEQYLDPFEEAMELVQSIVGIAETAAASIIAEIGTDMTRFASDKHLASWAGVSPGNKQSGGKRLSGKTTKGNPYLRAILSEVAWAISHTKDNYLSAFYHRMVRRHGKPKAIMALAHKVLVIIYHILRTKKAYSDLGADYFDQRDRGRIERHHIHRLEQLGYAVTLMPKEAA